MDTVPANIQGVRSYSALPCVIQEQSVKAVRFDKYGGIEVLQVANVPMPEPSHAQVLVGETKIREGLLHAMWPATFPSGEGSDLAGIVGDLHIPIAATFPLNQVRAAFSLLEQGHIRGKIVRLP